MENATGLGHLITQQLLAAGEVVLDVQPKLAARVRLLASGNTNKNDPNDARSVAVAGLRSTGPRPVTAEDHSAVMRCGRTATWSWPRPAPRWPAGCTPCSATWCPAASAGSLRARPLACCRRIDPASADRARCRLAGEFLGDLRRLDAQIRDTRNRLAAAVPGVRHYPDRHLRRRPGRRRRRPRRRRRHVPLRRPGPLRRLQRHRPDRGRPPASGRSTGSPARQPAPQPRHPHGRGHPDPVQRSPGRAYYDRKIAEGKTGKEALRCLKRRISDAIYARLRGRRQQTAATPPQARAREGNRGTTLNPARPAHTPRHRLSDKPLPGPPTLRPRQQPRDGQAHAIPAAAPHQPRRVTTT